MMHMYAQYGHIITNYVLILAITLVIWPESQETSNEIGHFVKVFLRHNQYTKFDIFIMIEIELKYIMQLTVSYIKHD